MWIKPTRANKANSMGLNEYRKRLMSNENSWCVASIPTDAWAKKVFPELSQEEAVGRLWEAILKSVRADLPDPVEAWNAHKATLAENIDRLNQLELKRVHIRNKLGTDLKVELPDGHIWMGGSDYTADGVEFIANMPTRKFLPLPSERG